MNNDDLVEVYVYPDGDVHEYEPADYKSDDYKVMKTTYCDVCGELIEPHYSEPLAFCFCGGRDFHE